jgi:hypothetical protein
MQKHFFMKALTHQGVMAEARTFGLALELSSKFR